MCPKRVFLPSHNDITHSHHPKPGSQRTAESYPVSSCQRGDPLSIISHLISLTSTNMDHLVPSHVPNCCGPRGQGAYRLPSGLQGPGPESLHSSLRRGILQFHIRPPGGFHLHLWHPAALVLSLCTSELLPLIRDGRRSIS